MGNFRSNSRGGFRGGRGSGFGGRSGGSRFGSGRPRRSRDSDGFDRGPREMFDVTCSKCGERCQVPFKPTGDKPVFCSDCFRQNEGGGSNFSSRNRDRGASGGDLKQLDQINKKLDKILLVLKDLELDVDDEEVDEEESEDEDDEDESEDEEEVESEAEDNKEDEEESDEDDKEDESEDEESEDEDESQAA